MKSRSILRSPAPGQLRRVNKNDNYSTATARATPPVSAGCPMSRCFCETWERVTGATYGRGAYGSTDDRGIEAVGGGAESGGRGREMGVSKHTLYAWKAKYRENSGTDGTFPKFRACPRLLAYQTRPTQAVPILLTLCEGGCDEPRGGGLSNLQTKNCLYACTPAGACGAAVAAVCAAASFRMR